MNCEASEGHLVSSLSLSFSSYLVLINHSYTFYWLHITQVKLHVYVKRHTRKLYHVTKFSSCRLPFIFATHKLVVSRNFVSIRIVLSCFYSFSILRNSHLESAVCRLAYTRSLLTFIP